MAKSFRPSITFPNVGIVKSNVDGIVKGMKFDIVFYDQHFEIQKCINTFVIKRCIGAPQSLFGQEQGNIVEVDTYDGFKLSFVVHPFIRNCLLQEFEKLKL